MYALIWGAIMLLSGGYVDLANTINTNWLPLYTAYLVAPDIFSPPTFICLSGYFNPIAGVLNNVTWLGLIWFGAFSMSWFTIYAKWKNPYGALLFYVGVLLIGMALWNSIYCFGIYSLWYPNDLASFWNAICDWLPPAGFSSNGLVKIAFTYGFGVQLTIILFVIGLIFVSYGLKFDKATKRNEIIAYNDKGGSESERGY